jgi:predicted nucleotidyltransferase
MEGNFRDIQLLKLTERAKELRCIYQVMEILKDEKAELITIIQSILEAIPPGYQYPTVCETRLVLEGKEYASRDFKETEWKQKADILIDNHVAGEIQVCYVQDVFEKGLIFMPEEQKLLNTIAEHLSQCIFHRRLKKTLETAISAETEAEPSFDSSLVYYESDEHWKWRYHVAEKIAARMDMDKFGIVAVYLIGSTKTGKAGPASDIDLMLHFRGTTGQENEVKAWLQGWGLGLAELNFIKTGYISPGSLIDFHFITDEDIRKKTSYAAMIGAVDNSAKLLRSRE